MNFLPNHKTVKAVDDQFCYYNKDFPYSKNYTAECFKVFKRLEYLMLIPMQGRLGSACTTIVSPSAL